MNLFREEHKPDTITRFRARELLLELALNELSPEREEQVEYWIQHCRETQADWVALTKALNWCEQKRQSTLVDKPQEPVVLQKSPRSYRKYLLAAVILLVAISTLAFYLYSIKFFDSTNWQLLATREKKVLTHLEALQMEIITTEPAKVQVLLNQFKKEGTEVKAIPGNQNNEMTWTVFVLQSHVQELIEQIKTLGLVRIPEGDSAELVSDGQIQIILKSKAP